MQQNNFLLRVGSACLISETAWWLYVLSVLT